MNFRFRLIFAVVVIHVCHAAAAQPVLASDKDEFQSLEEEILNIALIQCSQGDVEQAGILFKAILNQLNPPRNIYKFIEELLEKKCSQFIRDEKLPEWELKLGQGYDSNVTQGIRVTTLNIGTPELPVELVVDDSYRPRSSQYTDFSIQRNWKVSDTTQLTVRGNFRDYTKVREYGQIQSGVAFRGSLKWGGQNILWMLEKTDMWLNGRYYYSGWLGAAQIPWASQPQWQWTGLLQQLGYQTQSSQNSRIYQLGLQRAFSLGPGDVYVSAGWQWDRALGQRAGGDRQGPLLVVQGYRPVGRWLFSGRIAYAQWQTENDFLPGLLNMKRRNQLMQWGINAEYPINKNQKIQLGISQRISKDSIALYEHQGIGIILSWGMKF